MRVGVDVVPDPLDVERALADDATFDQLTEQCHLGAELGHAAGDALAQAHDARVGFEFEKQPLAMADRRVDVVQYPGSIAGDLDVPLR